VNLDLSEVEFIDSAGIGVLVGIKVSSKKHGADLSLVAPSRAVNDILVVTKLDAIFTLVTGPEARELIQNLSQPQFEKQSGYNAPAPAALRGPAQPVMPTASPAAPPAAQGKETIDKLCKDAVAHMQRGDYESAVNCYKQAITIQPDYLPAHNNLAIVYEKKPQWQANAIEQWKRVLEISSKNNDQKHIERAQKHIQNLSQLG
jgi:tetratricopeptide (TPR) repeat protein